MRTKKVIGLLVAIALSVSARATPAETSLTRQHGLGLMRGVLTLEVPFWAGATGQWGDLADIVKVSEHDAAAWKPLDGSRTTLVDEIVDSSTATVLDYTLRLTRSDDKKHLQVSLTPTVPKPDDDRLSWFSDDRCVIYTGTVIGAAPPPSASSLPHPQAQPSLTYEQGRWMMKGVMNLEFNLHASDGGQQRFGDLNAVVSLSERVPVAWRGGEGDYRVRILDANDANAAPVFDYTLQLTLSNDWKHFQLSLTPTVPKADGRPLWFADDRCIIYVGKPIG